MTLLHTGSFQNCESIVSPPRAAGPPWSSAVCGNAGRISRHTGTRCGRSSSEPPSSPEPLGEQHEPAGG
jgi:hypothetical protein